MSRLKKYDKPRSESLHKSAKIVFSLLLHHSYFLSETEKIKKYFRIPKNGYKSKESREKKEKYSLLDFYSRVISLLEKFDFPYELKDTLLHWTRDYITLNKITFNFNNKNSILLRTGFELYISDIKLDGVYLEITPSTTLKDIKESWKQIESVRKNNSDNRGYNLGVKKISEFGERLYELTKRGYSPKESVEVINKEEGRIVYSWNKIANSKVYNALAEYKKRLNELKEI